MSNEQNLVSPKGLVPINFSGLDSFPFATGDFYFCKKYGRPIKILKAGERIQNSLIERFENNESSVRLDNLAHNSQINVVMKYFGRLQKAQTDEKKALQRGIILKWFRSNFWVSNSEAQLIDLAIICYKVFCKFDNYQITDIFLNSSEEYKKTILSSSFAVMFGLGAGIVDFNILRDLYHTCFLLDYSLTRNPLDLKVHKAMKLEKIGAGRGLKSLEENSVNYKSFLLHPRQGVKECSKKFSHMFNYPNLLNLIERHHERPKGGGFPKGLNESNLGDLEAIIIFADNFLGDFEFKKSDGRNFLRNIFDDKRSKTYLSDGLRSRMLSSIDSARGVDLVYHEILNS
jgi:hypothetical protein